MKLSLFKGSELSIQLVEDEIFLSSSEEADSLIRGSVHFQTNQSILVNSLHLKLVGTIATNWNFEGRVIQDKIEVIRNELKLLQVPSLLSSGEHVYYFQSSLSHKLPASLKCRNGQVEYKLIVTLKSSQRRESKATRTIKLTKIEPPSSSVLTDSIFSQGKSMNLFSYQLACPHRAFGPRDEIPLNFLIFPLDSNFKYEVRSISCLVKRTVTMKTPGCDHQWVSKQKEEVLNIEQKTFSPGTRSVNETLYLTIQAPKQVWSISSKKIVPTASNVLMGIHYDVKAHITFKNSNNIKCDMALKFPIVIMTKNYLEVSPELPMYNNPDNLLIESASPSYHPTWCPLSRLPSQSSLPSYDETTSPAFIKPHHSTLPPSLLLHNL